MPRLAPVTSATFVVCCIAITSWMKMKGNGVSLHVYRVSCLGENGNCFRRHGSTPVQSKSRKRHQSAMSFVMGSGSSSDSERSQNAAPQEAHSPTGTIPQHKDL